MKYSLTKLNIARKGTLIIFGIALQFLFQSYYAIPAYSQTPDTLWSEDWEGDWVNRWYVDAGTWEVGTPTSGPGKAYKGENCAATVLNGNYSEGVRSTLIRFTKFNVPSTDQNPRLRFWHWFSFSSADYGYVKIKVGENDWVEISPKYSGVSSSAWTYSSIDLSAYADSLVQIGFYFHSDNYGGGNTDVSTGWYVDNIAMLYGPVTFNESEDFEAGIGDWYVDRGTWEVGLPESGPGTAHSGSVCAGTKLNGNYSEGVRSRLISPEYTVPSISENPRLRFWHWFSLSSADYGYVQIKVKDGEWQNIYSYYSGTSSSAWTYPSIDLSAYADSLVQFAFYFTSDNYGGGNTDVSTGWYVDDFTIVTGPYNLPNPEDFENGLGDWSVDRGTWEVGIPESGPFAPYSGDMCAATRLDGNYHEGVRSRLISPPFRVKSLSANPNLRFWHWYSFSSADYGEVHIKTGNSEWEILSNRFTSTSSGVYTTFYADLSAYADSIVQLGFYFYSDNYGGGNTDVSSGWYIDDISFPTSPPNLPPYTDNAISDTSFTEDSGPYVVSSDLNSVFSDPDGDDLTFSVSSDNPDIQPSIKNDSLFVESSPNYFGSGNVIVTATDPGGLSAKDTFLVEITPVDDPPGDFKLLSPEDNVTINSSNDSIEFVWNLSEDVDNDTIFYDLKIWSLNEDTLITDIPDTTRWVDGTGFFVNDVEYNWTVLAHDGFTIISAADTFTFKHILTGIEPLTNLIPEKYSLNQNYPNPFNPVTQIKFGLPKASNVKLVIYNALGQKVATLLNAHKSAGYHEVTFDGSKLSSGVYYYKIEAGKFVQVKKMLLVK